MERSDESDGPNLSISRGKKKSGLKGERNARSTPSEKTHFISLPLNRSDVDFFLLRMEIKKFNCNLHFNKLKGT